MAVEDDFFLHEMRPSGMNYTGSFMKTELEPSE